LPVTVRNSRTPPRVSQTRRNSIIMNSKLSRLGAQEHEILRAIAKSASVPLSSTQRLRFEMLGLIEDRADGVCLTERGRKVANGSIDASPPPPTTQDLHRTSPRDKRGRRLGHQRRSPF
jgi:hypothetical protein